MGISWKMVNLMGYEWDSRDSIHVYKKMWESYGETLLENDLLSR
jgi:hypothetical protein